MLVSQLLANFCHAAVFFISFFIVLVLPGSRHSSPYSPLLGPLWFESTASPYCTGHRHAASCLGSLLRSRGPVSIYRKQLLHTTCNDAFSLRNRIFARRSCSISRLYPVPSFEQAGHSLKKVSFVTSFLCYGSEQVHLYRSLWESQTLRGHAGLHKAAPLIS